VGPYTILAPLARGGTASVYLAEHDETKERVALKLLHPAYAAQSEIVERMFAERDVSESVSHRALLDVQAAETTVTGLPYLVMEYLDGENLGALADRGLMEIDAVIAIGAQIASALIALHCAGYVHCDIKPDNVFVLYQMNFDGWPRVKVIDYGVATPIDAPPSADNTIAGTPAYMAPEQWRGRMTSKTDLYALGCTLYELVTGEQPFHGTLPQLMLAHSEQLAERPSARRSDMPPALERLIMRLLSKDPGMRPTANETEVELGRISRQIAVPLETLELHEALAIA
jgi:serine/threonine-protein kinase